jgi:hypothetical protein
MELSLGIRLVIIFPTLLFLVGSSLKVFLERRSLRSIKVYEDYGEVWDKLSSDFVFMSAIDSIFLFIANGLIIAFEFEQTEIGIIVITVGVIISMCVLEGTYAEIPMMQRYGVYAVYGVLGGELAYFCSYGTDALISFIIPSVVICSILGNLNITAYPRGILEAGIISLEWRKFRDKIIETLEKFPNVKLTYKGGLISSDNPSEFWDGILEVGNRRVAIDIHTGRQFMGGRLGEWMDNASNLDEFRNRILSTAKKANIDQAFIIFDEDIRKRSEMSGYMSFLDTIVSQNKEDLELKILSGDPVSVAISVYLSCTEDS